jgi:hypothetical protein
VRRELLFLAIVALILVEVMHLKIWWNHWTCRRHARVHRECGCSRWVMFL